MSVVMYATVTPVLKWMFVIEMILSVHARCGRNGMQMSAPKVSCGFAMLVPASHVQDPCLCAQSFVRVALILLDPYVCHYQNLAQVGTNPSRTAS